MEENQFPPKDPEDKSREATIMEVFLGVCHIEERFHEAIKANDEKWKASKRIDDKRIAALTKMVKSQGNIIRTLENAHKKVMEGNLDEIMEINRQIYGGEFKKITNKAENELKKTEEAATAAQAKLGLWDNKTELILEKLDAAANQSATSSTNPQTPHTPATPGPLTPNTGGFVWCQTKDKTWF